VILGIGTDIVNIERVRKVLDRFGDRFEKRVFSELEIQRSRKKYDPSSSYAKRWAAKEACSKALGIGLRMGISWKEMHIVNLQSGKPKLIIEGKAKDLLKEMTPSGHSPKINVSLTDDHPWAKAIVIIEGITQ
jgi:holo-[acyl-carrier protein] synthase